MKIYFKVFPQSPFGSYPAVTKLRTHTFQKLLFFCLPGEGEVSDLVLESDEELCQVVVELGPLLQVGLQLHVRVVRLQVYMHLMILL